MGIFVMFGCKKVIAAEERVIMCDSVLCNNLYVL